VTISATYSPEDNKLRLYASTRLDAETFERVKAIELEHLPDSTFATAKVRTKIIRIQRIAANLNAEG
jgi:hypothetical protein